MPPRALHHLGFNGTVAHPIHHFAARPTSDHGQRHPFPAHVRDENEGAVALQLHGHQVAQVSRPHNDAQGRSGRLPCEQGRARARRAEAQQVLWQKRVRVVEKCSKTKTKKSTQSLNIMYNICGNPGCAAFYCRRIVFDRLRSSLNNSPFFLSVLFSLYFSGRSFDFIYSQKGKVLLRTQDGHLYVKEKQVNYKVYWRCASYTTKLRCHARMHTVRDEIVRRTEHSHESPKPRKVQPKMEQIDWTM